MQKNPTLLIIAAISIFILAMLAMFTLDVKDTTAVKENQPSQQ